ncbi:dynein regulatory complex subunit 5 [Embiotoca jacksoni]|uniref:dynein regulatory complex subunit 5 n=1 Tax=Embiotoca jacksoni TaxID=100190 RepID=UPI00370445B1
METDDTLTSILQLFFNDLAAARLLFLGAQNYRKMSRRIMAEDPDWILDFVPSLSNLSLQCIVNNFEERPIFEALKPTQRVFIQERLSPSLPLHVTANLVPDGVYWNRCCKQKYTCCDVSDYGYSWKRMFFERHLENIIEHFIPNVTEPKTVLQMAPLCKDYVKRLVISQLLPPIKEAQKEEEEEEEYEYVIGNERGAPCLDHFDFRILLDKLTNLEELHLVYRVKHCAMNFEWSMFKMTDQDCVSLATALKSCKTLKIFRLHLSQIEDKQCRLLVKYLLDHPFLRELDFSHNLIGDRGARAIGKLLTMSKLETLKMYNNQISGPGAKAIAHALSKNPALLSLNLCLNHLMDEGGEAIGKALLSNDTLLHLDLEGTGLTWLSAAALSKVLAQNNTMKTINLSNNKLGELGGKALEEAMSHNTSVTECSIYLTGVDERSVSLIDKVLLANNTSELKIKRK